MLYNVYEMFNFFCWKYWYLIYMRLTLHELKCWSLCLTMIQSLSMCKTVKWKSFSQWRYVTVFINSQARVEASYELPWKIKEPGYIYIVKLPKISNKINVHVVYWIPCASPPPHSIFNLIYWQHHHTCILAYSNGYNKHLTCIKHT